MKKIIIFVALLAACGGTPRPQDLALVETGPHQAPAEISVAQEKIVACQSYVHTSDAGNAGFVEFKQGGGAGSLVGVGVGSLPYWRFDSRASTFVPVNAFAQMCDENHRGDPNRDYATCDWVLGLSHTAAQTSAASGPLLVCNGLALLKTSWSSADAIEFVGGNNGQSWLFPATWDNHGTQWTTKTWILDHDTANPNPGECHWDFDPSNPVRIDSVEMLTFEPNATAQTQLPAIGFGTNWLSINVNYVSQGVAYEYRVVQPMHYDTPGPAHSCP